MKKVVVSFLIAVIVVAMVPVVGVSAKSKKSKMPKDGQKMYSITFFEWMGKGDGYWEVSKDANGKTQYRPYVLDDDGVRCVMPAKYYIEVSGRLYYTKKGGYISFGKNPRGYEVTKYGYLVIPDDTVDPEPAKDTETKDSKKKIKSISYQVPEYVIKDYSGTFRLVEVSTGTWYQGWYQDRYFGSYGMELGLASVDGDWYYFSRELGDLGKKTTNKWVAIGDSYSMSSLMYFDKQGKALVNQVVEIDGATYRFDCLGYLCTGWYDGHFYSSDPDRYGQQVQ